MAAHRRQIRNLLLNRKYQLHYTLVMVLLAALLTSGLGYFWYGEMRQASKILEVNALATMSELEVQQIEADLAKSDHRRLALLISFAILMALILAGYGIVITHKVAGPLYKIARHMADVRDGKLYDLRDIRRGDQLHDFWLTFKSMHEEIRSSTEHDLAILDRTIAAAEGVLNAKSEAREDLTQRLEELRGLRARKLASLDP